MDESAHFAGLDIGGTTVKAAILNSCLLYTSDAADE